MLVVGGSLGAKSINEAIDKGLDELLNQGLQVIWQSGKPYAAKAKERAEGKKGVWVNEFIMQMEYAYAAADIVVARSGAMTVAELCVAKKPALFVPYPFAAEDHQTVNAMTLIKRNAALMVKDTETMQKLVFMTIELAKDKSKQEELEMNISKLAITDADKKIAAEVLNCCHCVHPRRHSSSHTFIFAGHGFTFQEVTVNISETRLFDVLGAIAVVHALLQIWRPASSFPLVDYLALGLQYFFLAFLLNVRSTMLLLFLGIILVALAVTLYRWFRKNSGGIARALVPAVLLCVAWVE